ncbi:MAG: hypothetical protein DLM69_08320 [Candidatus Chloroheliales bacterium]|nr:MAG: hypothetical protein DLM69_08320 [Chloroflexota bacterium]
MRKLRYALLVAVVFSLLLGSYVGASVRGQSDELYFPQTGHAISGIFLNHWQTHGGLMQFGYPLSDQMGAASDLDGKYYPTQYFERAVFEYHVENQPPYDVLLTLLGSQRYKEKYPLGAPNQQPSTDHPYLFAVTGKTLGGKFIAYWEQHGGLMQFGYPLSNEFREVSELDGKSYSVQYFERAVFEYHPENQPPYDVLLSQIGRLHYEQKQKSAPPPLPLSQQIEYNIYPPHDIVGSGDYIFWTTEDGIVLHGYRISAQKEFTSTTDAQLFSLATNGKVVFGVTESDSNPPIPTPVPTEQAYQLAPLPTSNTSPFTSTIVSYDPVTGDKQTLLVFSNVVIGDLVVDAGTLYYYKGDNTIYAYNLTSGQQQQVAITQGQMSSRNGGDGLVAKDGYLLWSQYDSDHQSSLHLFKVGRGGQDTVLAKSGTSYFSYSLSGNNVVWSLTEQNAYSLDSGVHLYQISTGTTRLLTSDFGLSPLIEGNKVVWVKEEAIPGCTYSYVCTNYSIIAYDLSTGDSRLLVAPDSYAKGAALIVSPNTLVYVKEAGYKLDGAILYTVPLN